MPRPLSSCAALLALGLALVAPGLVGPAAAQGQVADSGAYLAANSAFEAHDYRHAAAWYARALLQDPGNPTLIERLSVAHLALGEVNSAATAARELARRGEIGQIPHLALLLDAASKADYASILAEKPIDNPIDKLTVTLLQGWAQFGDGRISEALATFDDLARTSGFEAFGLYHKALVMAAAGDYQGAEAILSGREGNLAPSVRGVFALVEVLSQQERNQDALAALDNAFGPSSDPSVMDLRRRLVAGEPIAFTTARTAPEGMAEAMYSIADALGGEADKAFALLFARGTIALRPDHVDGLMLAAELLEDLDQPGAAAEVYGQVPAESPQAIMASIAAANAAERQGDEEGALAILLALTKDQPEKPAAALAHADALRRADKCQEAIAEYDRAMSLLPEAKDQAWLIYYHRGSCQERLGNLDQMEADLRKALQIQPGQAQVLNYLGYSLVDRGLKLDEALEMIQEAVAAEPDAGHIIDSLAWALFRLGRYDEALPHMERASLLLPVDPVVTDHLGDVYWAVGRKREAEFQWHRALSFDPVEKDAARIRAKLDKGLDQVLQEEGAPPLTPAGAANGG